MTVNGTEYRLNWQKLVLLLSALAFMGTGLLSGHLDWDQVSAPFGLIIGAALQNGLGGARGHTVAPLVEPVDQRRRADDHPLPPPPPA